MSGSSLLRAALAAPTLLAITLTAAPAPAQPGSVEELREQIDALQQQLEKLEQDDRGDRRVTDLGGRRARDLDPELIVRLYDLGDLFALAPSYPAREPTDLGGAETPLFPAASSGVQSGGGFGGGGGFFRVDRPQTLDPDTPQELRQLGGGGVASGPRTSIDDLVGAITQTIAPHSWDEVGGQASIATLGTTLVVSADRQSHEQIEGLLGMFRGKWRTLRTISLRAWWLWLNDAQLEALVARGPGDAEGESAVGAFGLVEDAAWNEWHRAAAQQGDASGYRAAVTCYNGQTVHAVSGGQSLAVTDVEPVVADAESGEARPAIAYRPQVSVLDEGAALQVTPLASLSGRYVVLDVHSRVATIRPSPDSAADGGAEAGRRAGGVLPRDVVAALDRPAISVQRLSTTLRVPVERTMLIGGMTFDRGAEGGPANLYLFVRAAVQELRDDLEDQQPEVPPEEAAPADDEVPAGAEAPADGDSSGGE